MAFAFPVFANENLNPEKLEEQFRANLTTVHSGDLSIKTTTETAAPRNPQGNTGSSSLPFTGSQEFRLVFDKTKKRAKVIYSPEALETTNSSNNYYVNGIFYNYFPQSNQITIRKQDWNKMPIAVSVARFGNAARSVFILKDRAANALSMVVLDGRDLIQISMPNIDGINHVFYVDESIGGLLRKSAQYSKALDTTFTSDFSEFHESDEILGREFFSVRI